MLSNHLTLNHLIIFSFCLQSFPASGSFPKSQLLCIIGPSTRASTSALVLPMNIQGWFTLGLTSLISLQSKGLSRVLLAPQLQSINSSALSFLYGSTLTTVHNYWKNHNSDYMAFVGKVMSLLFNTLSRLHLGELNAGCLYLLISNWSYNRKWWKVSGRKTLFVAKQILQPFPVIQGSKASLNFVLSQFKLVIFLPKPFP